MLASHQEGKFLSYDSKKMKSPMVGFFNKVKQQKYNTMENIYHIIEALKKE